MTRPALPCTPQWSSLATLRLDDGGSRRVLDLPAGKRRLVESALSLEPSVMLFDEPAARVPSLESHRILEALERLPATIAVPIIEHDMDLVFRFAQRSTALVQGGAVRRHARADRRRPARPPGLSRRPPCLTR